MTLFSTQENLACHIPTNINEQVDGTLDNLPGCNPATYGPDRTQPASCSDPPTPRPRSINHIDVTQTKQWEYTGCGTDSVSDRAFPRAMTTRNDMTVESCIDFCSSAGFAYAGLEYGSECFCADELNPTYAPRDGILGACTMKCAGNADQICGAANAMSVYHRCADKQCRNNEIGGEASVQRLSMASLAARSPETLISTITSTSSSFLISTLVSTSTTTSASSAVVSTQSPSSTGSTKKRTRRHARDI